MLTVGNAPLPPAIQGKPYILLLGNITPNKNVGFLIEALRLLASESRPVRALHVGRDLTGDLARATTGDGCDAGDAWPACDTDETCELAPDAAFI